MKLVIAEKPSVGQSIASVIGANKRCEGYLEGNGYIVSWCFGHLVSLCHADAYDEKYKSWNRDDLPILPQSFKWEVTSDKKSQFKVLRTLMFRDDVDELICATDAGREGELIFRLVYNEARCNKPFKRLWISSMEDEAIREGFMNLKPGHDYDNLYDAAISRSEADWLVGINATRLFSTLYGRKPKRKRKILRYHPALMTAFAGMPMWSMPGQIPGSTMLPMWQKTYGGKSSDSDTCHDRAA